MIFIRYFLKRFLLYLGVLSCLGGFLFSCVEFFERVARSAHVPFPIIISFVALNFMPLVMQSMPLFIALTSCLVIRELSLYDHFTVLSLVGMRRWYLASCFLMVGCGLGVAIGIVKEVMMSPLYVKVIQYKQEYFKRISSSDRMSIDGWFSLDDHQWCYVGGVDQQTGQLEDVILLHNKNRLDDHIVYSRYARVTDEQIMLSDDAAFFDPTTGKATSGQPMKRSVAGLEKNLMLKSGHLSLITLTSDIMRHGFVSPLVVQEWGQRLLWYLFMIFYPFILYLLFSASYLNERARWISMIASYPLATLIQAALCALI